MGNNSSSAEQSVPNSASDANREGKPNVGTSNTTTSNKAFYTSGVGAPKAGTNNTTTSNKAFYTSGVDTPKAGTNNTTTSNKALYTYQEGTQKAGTSNTTTSNKAFSTNREDTPKAGTSNTTTSNKAFYTNQEDTPKAGTSNTTTSNKAFYTNREDTPKAGTSNTNREDTQNAGTNYTTTPRTNNYPTNSVSRTTKSTAMSTYGEYASTSAYDSMEDHTRSDTQTKCYKRQQSVTKGKNRLDSNKKGESSMSADYGKINLSCYGDMRKKMNSAYMCNKCDEIMSGLIYLCGQGHSVCHKCKDAFDACKCGSLIGTINHSLHAILQTMMFKCPQEDEGCKGEFLVKDLEAHLQSCLQISNQCPLKRIFNKCFWTGKFSEMELHFQQKHPNHCLVLAGNEISLSNISRDDYIVHFIKFDDALFLVHVKINNQEGIMNFSIQKIGSTYTKDWQYELQIYNKSEPRRKCKYTNCCCELYENPLDVDYCVNIPLSYIENFKNNHQVINYKFYLDDIGNNEKRRPQNGYNRGRVPRNKKN